MWLYCAISYETWDHWIFPYLSNLTILKDYFLTWQNGNGQNLDIKFIWKNHKMTGDHKYLTVKNIINV